MHPFKIPAGEGSVEDGEPLCIRHDRDIQDTGEAFHDEREWHRPGMTKVEDGVLLAAPDGGHVNNRVCSG